MKTSALLLTLPILALAGCTTQNRSSVELRAVCATTDDCTFSATCTNTYMGEPEIDAANTDFLWVPIEAVNQLPDNRDTTVGRVNTHDAHVDTIVLDFGSSGFGKVTYATNQTIPTNGTTVLGVYLIPPWLNAGAALQAYAPATTNRALPVNVSIHGYYDDGSRFETGDFPISIHVCQNCIGACPAGTVLGCFQLYQEPRSCK